jgi:hypothetical protein
VCALRYLTGAWYVSANCANTLKQRNVLSVWVRQVHGDEDMVVSHKWGAASHELLTSLLADTAPTPPQFMTIEVSREDILSYI